MEVKMSKKAGLLLTAILIPAPWRTIDRRQKKKVRRDSKAK
jgi:hypothetical protein